MNVVYRVDPSLARHYLVVSRARVSFYVRFGAIFFALSFVCSALVAAAADAILLATKLFLSCHTLIQASMHIYHGFVFSVFVPFDMGIQTGV